jgi:hypothetical protein
MLKTEAEVELADHGETSLTINGVRSDPELAVEVVKVFAEYLGLEFRGCRVSTSSEIPVAVGLKSSSSAAVAIARAYLDAVGNPLIDWLRNWVWRLQGVYDAEDAKASAALCILEMLKTGTTAFVEVHLHSRYGFNGIAELVEKSGIRGVLSKSVKDMGVHRAGFPCCLRAAVFVFKSSGVFSASRID